MEIIGFVVAGFVITLYKAVDIISDFLEARREEREREREHQRHLELVRTIEGTLQLLITNKVLGGKVYAALEPEYHAQEALPTSSGCNPTK